MKFKKFLCKIFSCKIISHKSIGFLNYECSRCGDVFRITSKEKDWYERAIKVLSMENAIFSHGRAWNVDDYRQCGQIK